MSAKCLLALIALVLVAAFSAQAQSVLEGRVTDVERKPLTMATVILLKDSVQQAASVTDKDGSYRIVYTFNRGQQYTLTVSLLGFQSFNKSFIYPDTTALTSLQLAEERAVLAGVTVTAKRPLVTQKVDRYIVNVENSFLATGHSGLEVLQKSPGVWVKPDGSLQLRGGQGVSVMINDVVQRMSGEDLAEYLKTIKSEDIARIEIIHNPPAEFEAAGSGGIIHIVLKKGRKDGLNGSVNAQYRSQDGSPYGSGGASLDYKIKQLYLFGGGSLVSERNTSWGSNKILYASNDFLESSIDRRNRNQRQQYRLGFGYDINRAHTLGVQTVGNSNQLLNDFATATYYQSGNAITTGQATSDWVRKPSLFNTTINYAWKIDSLGTQLKIIGDYTSSNREETNQFEARYSDPLQDNQYRNQTPNYNRNYSAQADFSKHVMKQLDITSGVKYSLLKRDNEVFREDWHNSSWVVNPNSNRFRYNERLLMAYATLSVLHKHTTIKAGLRVEGTNSKGYNLTSGDRFERNYVGLFPSVYLMQTLAKNNAVFLNYARRLQRPGFSELNPYRLQVDNYSVMMGNPALKPQYTHKLEAGFNGAKGYSGSVYYSSTVNTIAQLGQSLDNNVMEYQYQNFDKTTEYGVSLNIPVTIVKGWTATNSFSLYNLSYTIADFEQHQTSFTAQTIQNFTLKKIADLYVVADYQSATVRANSQVVYQLYTDVGLTRKVFKKSNGRVRLFVTDPFNLLREKERTSYKGVLVNFYQKRQTRLLGLAFTYSFTSGKAFTKKNLEQSNGEERNRIGN